MAPSLRPVPFRPSGPVDPAEAARHVAAALPGLDDEAQRALALIEVAGRPRDAVAVELHMDGETLAQALARARKALRRSVFPLSATGWCERAERLLSDQLDGVLQPPGPARLDAHLRHCGRCVEHERRLAQARDALVREYADLHGTPEPEPEPEPADEPPPAAPLRIVPEAGLPALEPAEPPAELEPAPEPAAMEPAHAPAAVEPPAHSPAVERVSQPAPVEPAAMEPEPTAVEPEPAAVEAEPSVSPSSAAPAPPLPEQLRHPRVVVGVAAHGNAVWSVLHVVALMLAALSVALTVLAATGTVERVF